MLRFPTLRLRSFPSLRPIHSSQTLLRRIPNPSPQSVPPYLLDRLCRILLLERFDAVSKLSFSFSDDLLDSVLARLRLEPVAALGFFRIAAKQPYFRPNCRSYCKMIHILSKARMLDDARACLKELVSFFGSKDSVSFVFDEMVRVYKEFSFSPTVFDMLLKVYAEGGLIKHALHVFDNMGKFGRIPSLRSCNSLLSCLVRNKESRACRSGV
ncbi:Pentatricopeptide repeat-containing protein [Dioscorea alata]|uniref:Pentatricopeptide repeat-containing protein n=1 Tax=Dioscorea alata TaxID=55571 RepID=A0ACB7WRR3_DIOAL|nr:Pentatricopeptide repeat-containing protein [Dioscorea alata]